MVGLDPRREFVDPEMIGIYARLISVLQNALRRDTYVDLNTITLTCEAIAANCRFNLWVLDVAKKRATQEQFMTLLEQDDGVRELCVNAVIRFHEDHDRSKFHAVLREIPARLDDIKKVIPQSENR